MKECKNTPPSYPWCCSSNWHDLTEIRSLGLSPFLREKLIAELREEEKKA